MKSNTNNLNNTITKEALKRKLENDTAVQLVNVLEPKYYNLGLIQGSLKIPLSQLPTRFSELDPSREVITYCASYDCPASQEAQKLLADKGFKVSAYEGGIKEWTKAGYPLEPSDENLSQAV